MVYTSQLINTRDCDKQSLIEKIKEAIKLDGYHLQITNNKIFFHSPQRELEGEIVIEKDKQDEYIISNVKITSPIFAYEIEDVLEAEGINVNDEEATKDLLVDYDMIICEQEGIFISLYDAGFKKSTLYNKTELATIYSRYSEFK